MSARPRWFPERRSLRRAEAKAMSDSSHRLLFGLALSAREGLPVSNVHEGAAEQEHAQQQEGDDPVERIQVGQVEEEHLEGDDGEQSESRVASVAVLEPNAAQDQP